MLDKDVINFYNQLENLGIKIWIDGGWAVDALLGKQTRDHQDLDIVVQQEDLQKVVELLKQQNYEEVTRDDTRPWNFVLGDNQGRQIDFHVIVLDSAGNGIYGPVENGSIFPAESLTGTGTIKGQTVRCISAKAMVGFLAPWIHKHPHKYVSAVSMLCEKFGILIPAELTKFKNHAE